MVGSACARASSNDCIFLFNLNLFVSLLPHNRVVMVSSGCGALGLLVFWMGSLFGNFIVVVRFFCCGIIWLVSLIGLGTGHLGLL